MPDLSPPGVLLFILLVVVLLWFALGTQRNIKRGNEVLSWLQGGLPLLGHRTTLKWLGSSAVQLTLTEVNPPLTTAEVLVVLEPRDLGWLWAWSRRKGRRDFLILRARLERSPRFELEAGDRGGWTGTDRISKLDREAWQEATWDPAVVVLHGSDADPQIVRRVWEDIRAQVGSVWRLSIRRDNPHIELHVPLADTHTVGAKRLVGSFLELGRITVSDH